MIDFIKFNQVQYINEASQSAYTICKSKIDNIIFNKLFGKYIQSCKDCLYEDNTLTYNDFKNILKTKPICPGCGSFNVILSYLISEIPGTYFTNTTADDNRLSPLYETQKRITNIYSDWVEYNIIFEDYDLLTDEDKQSRIKV